MSITHQPITAAELRLRAEGAQQARADEAAAEYFALLWLPAPTPAEVDRLAELASVLECNPTQIERDRNRVAAYLRSVGLASNLDAKQDAVRSARDVLRTAEEAMKEAERAFEEARRVCAAADVQRQFAASALRHCEMEREKWPALFAGRPDLHSKLEAARVRN